MNASQQFHTVDARHVYVTQQNIDIALFETTKRSFTIRRGLHAITQPFQFLLQNQTEVCFILSDQNSCLLLLAQTVCSSLRLIAEREIVKVVPVPTVDCTSRVPPCSVKIP